MQRQPAMIRKQIKSLDYIIKYTIYICIRYSNMVRNALFVETNSRQVLKMPSNPSRLIHHTLRNTEM